MTMNRYIAPLRYYIFALVAIFANLGSQFLSFFFYQGQYAFHLAVFSGTAIGLVVKYWLDKTYIFFSVTKSGSATMVEFFLYSVTGVITTFVFWVTEALFFFATDIEGSQYIGGFLGLAFGYQLKFILDSRFIFGWAHENN